MSVLTLRWAGVGALAARSGAVPSSIVDGVERRVSQRGEVERVLADPSFEVPAVPSGDSGLAWLRSTVSRFVNGDDHARRRALVEAEIARLDPAGLRAGARLRTEEVLEAAGGRIELMTAIARPVPLATLAQSLLAGDGTLAADAAADAVVVGPAYLAGGDDDEVDAAVEELRRLVAREGPEEDAAAIAVLAQASEATAGLIANAFVLAAAEPALQADVNALLRAALRRASPLRAMRRVGPEGEAVILDLEAAGRDVAPDAPPLAFGSGIRPCPGADQALALAAGVLEALLPRCAPGPDGPTWMEGPLRLPQSLELLVN
jgi:cytochrome P450